MKNLKINAIRIIDQRSKAKFIIDDEYLNGYARLCGIYATGVYVSLCRHSNRDQFCFPSESLMAQELNISTKSIQRAICRLREWNIIEIEKNKRKNGIWKNNTYKLLDKSIWKPKPIQETQCPKDSSRRTVSLNPRDCESSDHKTVGLNKETNREGNTSKDINADSANISGNEINKIMEVFSKINPMLNWANKTIRNSASDLIYRYGFETTIRMAEQVVSIQGKSYAPVAINPYEMKEKLTKFKLYFDRQKNEEMSKKPKISIIS